MTKRRMRRRRSWWGLAAALALVAAALVGAVATREDAPASDTRASAAATPGPAVATPGSAGATPGSAVALLATIPVKGKAPKTGYDRTEDFGTAWLDVDRNGCDTRNDILARDLTELQRSGVCTVTAGTLISPYSGTTIAFVRGNTTSTEVQIDHVVPLMNAWTTGAQQLTQEQRIRLANDPINLLAVDAASNQQKSAGDAATWLPADKAERCGYVARQVSVKAAYGLWMAPAERDAIGQVLASCPEQPAYASTLAAADGDGAITPGAVCGEVGASGVADNGRSYRCGGKGADASGKYHWNRM